MRVGVPLLTLATLGLAGCGYPEFKFDSAPDAAMDAAGDAAMDATGDAAMDATDDAAMDGKGDAALDAREVSVEAGPPDTSGADTSASAGCKAISADFCADFDSVTAVGTGFTNADVQGPGSLFLDPSGRSLPNAFLATAGVPASGTRCTAFLYKNFTAPAPKSPMRAEAWLKLDAATLKSDAGGAAFLLKLERTGTTGDGVTLSIDGSGLFAERIGVTYARYPIAAKVKPGAWMHVRIDAVLHTIDGSFKVFVDDLTTPVAQATGVSTVMVDDDRRTLDVGLFVERASGAFAARFDDVSFSFK